MESNWEMLLSFMHSATFNSFSEKILHYKLFSLKNDFSLAMYVLIYSGLVLQDGDCGQSQEEGESRSHSSQGPCYQSILLGQKRF